MSSAPDSGAPAPFFTDRHAPQLRLYHEALEEMTAADSRGAELQIESADVRSGDVTTVQFLVLAAQHHPLMLERLLFGIQLLFEHPRPTLPDELTDEATWKSDPTVQRWLARVNQLLPWAVYFVQDHDARFYMLFGDILNRERDALAFRPLKNGHDQMVGIQGEQAQQLLERIVRASIFLLHFCRPAGLVPQPAIEALLAEFDVEERAGWGYEQVYAAFAEEVASGFELRAVPGNRADQDALVPWGGPEPAGDDDDDRF